MKIRLWGLRSTETDHSASRLLFGFTLALGFSLQVAQAGQSGQPASSLGSLSHEVMAMGLKQALTNGVKAAISELGHDGGFLTNVTVRIPMPEKLQTVEKSLRALKQDQLADEFVATMNHAAERAVPEAGTVFWEASARSDSQSMDIDAYVTQKAMDGLFKIVAEEEHRIRQNPLGESNDLLRQVFGSLQRK